MRLCFCGFMVMIGVHACRPVWGYEILVRKMAAYGIPKLLILCLLLLLLLPQLPYCRVNCSHGSIPTEDMEQRGPAHRALPRSGPFQRKRVYQSALPNKNQCGVSISSSILNFSISGWLAEETLTTLGWIVCSHDIEHHDSMDITKAAGFAWDP